MLSKLKLASAHVKEQGFIFPFTLFIFCFFLVRNAAGLTHFLTYVCPTHSPAQSCISVDIDEVQTDAFKCIYLKLMLVLNK